MNLKPALFKTLLAACLAVSGTSLLAQAVQTQQVQTQQAQPQPPRPAGLKAAEIGRLFTTPEQRERIDNPGRAPILPEASSDGRIDGVVRRSDGRTVVWIDGTPRIENNQALPTLSVMPAKGQK